MSFATKGLCLAAFLAGGLTIGTPAQAGGCPVDKVVPAGQGQPQGAAPAKDVTDSVLVSTDLSKEPAGINDRLLRLRRLVIKPGGIVPWHSHGDRPAIIYIVEGEITEYASSCAVPIVHRTGEATAERNPTAHWWKNTGSKTVVLLSADLFPVKDDAHVM